MDTTKTPKRIGILVVHGVGEQTKFEHLEDIAGNLYNALRWDPTRSDSAHIQVNVGKQVPHHAESGVWEEAPVVVNWRKPVSLSQPGQPAPPAQAEEWMEVKFSEVHWADLDMPFSWGQWVALVSWALSMSGARVYDRSPVSRDQQAVRCLPRKLTRFQRFTVRLKLFFISWAFFLLLMSNNLINFALTRLNLPFPWLQHVRDMLHQYLGDVKLYQDWFTRVDSNLESIGEKSRVAIRRRMVRALARMAEEVRSGRLDGYYIFAHSLGTVVAFNGLMELSGLLPGYLTNEEWSGLNATFRDKNPNQNLGNDSPRLPRWLDPTDFIKRDELFKGLRGFLTMGSPLDKYAALWPHIVPINTEPGGSPFPKGANWYNVADHQDIVAGFVDLFYRSNATNDVAGLPLTNYVWADQWIPFTAHTSYWKAKERKHDRLINRIIVWLEGRGLQPPEDRKGWWVSPCTMKVLSIAWMVLAIAFFLFLTCTAVWLVMVPTPLASRTWDSYGAFLLAGFIGLPVIGFLVVTSFLLARRWWEWKDLWKSGKGKEIQRLKHINEAE